MWRTYKLFRGENIDREKKTRRRQKVKDLHRNFSIQGIAFFLIHLSFCFDYGNHRYLS